MYMGRHFSATIIICTLLICPSSSASDWDEDDKSNKPAPKPTNASRKFILHGQVQHSERLPALSDDLQAGANFQPAGVSQAKYASSWFKIPDWFAGTFQSSQSTIEFIKDYATGKSSRPNKTVASVGQELHGYQQDSGGEIWHFYVKSGSSKSEQAGQTTFNTIDWYGPVYVGEDKVIIKILATSLLVDNRSGIIVDSFRREDIKTYEPAGSGMLKVSYTSKSFDSKGRPRDLQDGVSIYQRIAPFHAIDKEGEQDFRQMFHDFMASKP